MGRQSIALAEVGIYRSVHNLLPLSCNSDPQVSITSLLPSLLTTGGGETPLFSIERWYEYTDMNEKRLRNILSLLRNDHLRNMNAIYFIQDYPVQTLERIGDAVLIRGESDRHWVYISATDPGELGPVVDRLSGEDTCFAATEDWMVPILTRGKAVIWDLSMVRLLFARGSVWSFRKTELVQPLRKSDAQFIYDNSPYKELTSPGYIRDRIERGPTGGIYGAGQPVAWALTHDDGSIGMMKVLEAHRRKGYARILTMHLINKVREQGRIPYVHIEEKNVAAMNVVAGLGFVRDRRLHWFEIQRG